MRGLAAAALTAMLGAPLGVARADNPPPETPAPGNQSEGESGAAEAERHLLGGLRSVLDRYGVTFDASETDEVLGVIAGGIRTGAVYEGLTDVSLRWDLRRSFGWRGEFFARAFQIHGRGLSANYLGNLNTASAIEADRATRLFELWYEQNIGDWLRIRIGQQAADQEFLVSTTAKLFVNATFGFPTVASANLPSGGPAYPLATPAVRLRFDVNDDLTVFTVLFNGDPAGPGAGDPQQRDASGTAFRTRDGAFAIAEIRYNPGNTPSNGTYRLGAWFNSERFASQRFDSAGLSLASPFSSGAPRLFGNDYSVYGIIDQPLFHRPDSDAGLTVFLRAMGAPSDRNLVDFYIDGGLAYRGPFGRADDVIGAAFGFARIGSAARQLDADRAAFSGGSYPVRSSETMFELSYQFQATPWLQLQPDFQYVVNPGGGVANPDAPARRIGDAAVLGFRAMITF